MVLGIDQLFQLARFVAVKTQIVNQAHFHKKIEIMKAEATVEQKQYRIMKNN